MLRKFLILGIVLASAAPAAAAAAQRLEVTAGTRMRTTIAGTQREFNLVVLGADTVVLADDAHREFRLALRDLDSLQASAGRKTSDGFFLGGMKGLAIFGLAGVAIGFLSGNDPPGFISMTKEEKAVGFGAVLGGVGFLLGGIRGATAETHIWVRVPID